MANYPDVKTDIINGVTETDGNQINNIEDYVGTRTDTDPTTITHKLTNPASVSPGHKHNVSDLNGGADGTMVYKDPVDSIWKAWLPDTIGLLTKAEEQTITAKKTFTVLPESETTPTSDNQLVRKRYVDDNVVLPKYGGMYRQNFSEADPPVYWGYRQALRGFVEQPLSGVTFSEGATGVIQSFNDAGNGLARIESIGHGLVTGDIITINDSAWYNRQWEVTYFDENNFTIFCILFVPDTPTATTVWIKPSSLKVNVGAAGTYKVNISALLNIPEGLPDPYEVEGFINDVSMPELYLPFVVPSGNGVQMNVSRTALITLAENDTVWMSILNRHQTIPVLMPEASLVINRIDA